MRRIESLLFTALLCLVFCRIVSASRINELRPEVKIYIDKILKGDIFSIEHTTDSDELRQIRLPDNPKSFEAGRYKVVFVINRNEKETLIFQTEEIVGHMALVTPGKTDIGGFVYILRNPDSDMNEDEAEDLKLNEAELDYLIRTLYKKFMQPVTNSEAVSLNQVKDFALAIKFSKEKGITEYHNALLNELR